MKNLIMSVLLLTAAAHADEPKAEAPQPLKIAGTPSVALEIQPNDDVLIQGKKVGNAPGAYANIGGAFANLQNQLKACGEALEKKQPSKKAAK